MNNEDMQNVSMDLLAIIARIRPGFFGHFFTPITQEMVFKYLKNLPEPVVSTKLEAQSTQQGGDEETNINLQAVFYQQNQDWKVGGQRGFVKRY